MNIRAVIVDDEALARQRVRQLASGEPDVEILAECASGAEACTVLLRERPQLVFLDVQMPEMDGFDVLDQVPGDCLPLVIFTTAFDRHAIRAFDAHALDYLLKPLRADRFREAIERARARLGQQQARAMVTSLLTFLDERTQSPPLVAASTRRLTRLTVKADDKVVVVRTADIDAIESAGNYVSVHVGPESYIVRDSLTALEAQLDPHRFLRVSRGALVNLTRVKELHAMAKGEHLIVLHNGRRLPMSRGLREVERALRFS
jgi:two-component system LytT family response regulator